MNYNYANSVGRNRTAWEARNSREIASSAGIDESRVTGFALTETAEGW